jgi:valyl-tRNA synthetase
MVQPWPHVQEQQIDKKIEKEAQAIFNLIKEIRNLRSSLELKADQKVIISVYPHTKFIDKLIKNNITLITHLAKLETLGILDFCARPSATISAVTADIDIYLHFSGLLDLNKERLKISKKIDEMEKIKNLKEQRIRNPEFLKKAPKDVIEKERGIMRGLKNSLERLERMLNELC